MLTHLRIRNWVVVEDVALDVGPGLTVLTGETGAGKSILVEALALLAGGRASVERVRSGADVAIVEGVFSIAGRSDLEALLAARGLASGDGQLIVRREVRADGSGSRVFVNDRSATVASLRELAAGLVDIYGQHEHQHLLSRARHRALLDAFGGHDGSVEGVADAFDRLTGIEAEVSRLRSSVADRLDRADLLRAHVAEIEATAPEPGERDRLAEDRRLLRSAGRIVACVERVASRLSSEEGASDATASAAKDLAALADVVPAFGTLADRLEAARLEIEDVASEVSALGERLEFEPGRAERVEERAAALDRLFTRFGKDEDEVLGYLVRAREELAALDTFDERVDAAEAELVRERERYDRRAAELSRARSAAAGRLVPRLVDALTDLALAGSRIDVALESRKPGRFGRESVELLFSANAGEPVRPLSKVASGGELARLMLALHGVLLGDASPRVLVFDEVDTGVGGATADAVGRRIAALARRHQAFCVTHSPQVAAYADRHLRVVKATRGERVTVEVGEVADRARVDELARMLGGSRASGAARDNAVALLRSANGGAT